MEATKQEAYDERLERERAEKREKVAAHIVKAKAVAPLLDNGPWVAEIKAELDACAGHVRLLRADGAAVYFTGEGWRMAGRVGAGAFFRHDYWPSGSERPAEITMTATKSAEAMAKEINRRFLPAYLEAWAKQEARRKTNEAQLNRQETLTRELCDLIGCLPMGLEDTKSGAPRGNPRAHINKGEVYGDITPHYSGGSFKVELSGVPWSVVMKFGRDLAAYFESALKE